MTLRQRCCIRLVAVLLAVLLPCMILCGCGGKTASDSADHSGPPRDNTPKVLSPSADHVEEYSCSYASIDASNSSQGYIMAAYNSGCDKVKIQITDPNQTVYTYLLPKGGSYQTFPLSGGNGSYSIRIMENVSGDSYAIVMSQDISVTIADEFLPYLYPNQYVNFDESSAAVAKGAELAADTYTDLEVVENVYNFVIDNIKYDDAKAASVTYGYIPDVDATLESGNGICFDYAALMCCMLRSQGIPTKLETGYSGTVTHAWISTYVDDIGWVDGIIEFDGSSWKLMDPTFAANNDSSSVSDYIGDGSNYTLKNSY